MQQQNPTGSSIALTIDRLMRRIHAELHPQAAEFDTHNVGPLGGMLLLTIADSEPIDVQTVTRALGRDKSQISRLIKKTEEQGLIHREKNADDGRSVVLTLTDDGRRQLEKIQAALTSTIEDILKPLDASERDVFRQLLSKVAPR